MSPDFDVVIVGAGIQGAGVAQACAARGWRTLVLEQAEQPAEWTSSRSSKLIHGGLRYLENGEFGLVREALRERALLLRNAPDLVKLTPFYIPVYDHSRRHPLTIRAGLSLYALLGGLRRETRFNRLAPRQWGDLDGLAQQGLRAVYRYFDAQTDDAALTRAVVRSARQLGADIHLGAQVTGLEMADDGVRLRVQRRGLPQRIKTRVLINATGPWVNRLLDLADHPLPRMEVALVQGTHIVIPGALRQGIYYVEAPQDGRAVFLMPWRGQTLVGTTETLFNGDPAQVAPAAEEIDYLQAVVRHYFPDSRLQPERLISTFAGLRVLPQEARRPFQRPREVVIAADRPRRPRILSLYGGKLTVYRATAAKVAARLAPWLPRATPLARTEELLLQVNGG